MNEKDLTAAIHALPDLGDRELVRLAAITADRLEDRDAAFSAGVVRRLAARLAELSPASAAPSCPGCGEPLPPRDGPGRPRRFHGEACRSRWRRGARRPENRPAM